MEMSSVLPVRRSRSRPVSAWRSCGQILPGAASILILALFCASVVGSPLHAAARELTVMTYNIRVGYGARDRGVDPYTLSTRGEHLGPIIAAIRSVDPHLVGLQEVLGAGQARRLAAALGMAYAYAGHATGGSRPSWWGVALLSRYPILDSRGIQISSGRGDTKSALICRVDVDGRPVTVLSVHKDKDLTDGGPFRRIVRALEAIDTPVVIAGDFNVHPSDERLGHFFPRFVDTAAAADTPGARRARKIGTFLRVGRIDYVFAERRYFVVLDAGITARDHWQASDHLGYYACLGLKTVAGELRGEEIPLRCRIGGRPGRPPARCLASTAPCKREPLARKVLGNVRRRLMDGDTPKQ